MRRFLALTIAAFFIATDPAAGAGFATSRHGDTTTIVTDSTVSVTAGHVADRILTDGPGSRPGRVITCQFWEVYGSAFTDVDPFPVRPREGELYELRCVDEGEMVAGFPVFIIYDPGVLIDPAVSTEEISAFAYDAMTFDALAPTLNPVAEQIVGIPTWLAVTSRLDYPSVSAAAGPVWATVRPQLRDAVFTMPNGDTITCTPATDLTTTWDPTQGAGQTSACTYTFTANGRAAADADPTDAAELEVVVDVTWDLYRMTNLNPAEQFYLVHTETTVVPITVRELQAVID